MADPAQYGQPLGPREYEALRLQAIGLTVADIGLAWGISRGTVKGYLNRAHVKLGVNTAVEAFRLLGWLRAPDAGTTLSTVVHSVQASETWRGPGGAGAAVAGGPGVRDA